MTLRAGQIVRRDDERGVVEWSCGQGCSSSCAIGPPMRPSDALILLGAGHHVVTDMHDEWLPVPDRETTFEERVRSAAVSWEGPTWLEEGDDERDTDSFAFALLRAFIPPDALESVFPEHGDLPTSCEELAIEAARRLDDRVEFSRSVGAWTLHELEQREKRKSA